MANAEHRVKPPHARAGPGGKIPAAAAAVERHGQGNHPPPTRASAEGEPAPPPNKAQQ